VLVSEYYATFGEMRRTLSEYLRTSGPRLDIMDYIGRQSLVLKDLVETISSTGTITMFHF